MWTPHGNQGKTMHDHITGSLALAAEREAEVMMSVGIGFLSHGAIWQYLYPAGRVDPRVRSRTSDAGQYLLTCVYHPHTKDLLEHSWTPLSPTDDWHQRAAAVRLACAAKYRDMDLSRP